MSNLFGKRLDVLQRATKSAFNRGNSIIGQRDPTSRNLKLYEKMDEATLNKIGEMFGSENLLRYIQHMEALRIKNNG